MHIIITLSLSVYLTFDFTLSYLQSVPFLLLVSFSFSSVCLRGSTIKHTQKVHSDTFFYNQHNNDKGDEDEDEEEEEQDDDDDGCGDDNDEKNSSNNTK